MDASHETCTLTIKNISKEDVTVLDALNKAGGMSRDFPMGTNVRFKGSAWILVYSISSNLYDHGPGFTTERSSGRIIARPPQKDVVIHAGDSLVRKFSVADLLRFIAAQRQKSNDSPFQLQIYINVAQGETYKGVPIESEWIENAKPLSSIDQ